MTLESQKRMKKTLLVLFIILTLILIGGNSKRSEQLITQTINNGTGGERLFYYELRLAEYVSGGLVFLKVANYISGGIVQKKGSIMKKIIKNIY